MGQVVRSYRTKDVIRLAAESGIEGVYRELLAEISDLFGWGDRRATERGPGTGMREWSRKEAEALVQVAVLRQQGFGFDDIACLIEEGPEKVLAPLAELLSASRNVIDQAM